MKNVLILVDAGSQLDSADAAERKRAVEEHKGWIDCAAQLKCDAIRVNCRSGGDREENLRNAADGMGALCDYAKPSGVKVVIRTPRRKFSGPRLVARSDETARP